MKRLSLLVMALCAGSAMAASNLTTWKGAAPSTASALSVSKPAPSALTPTVKPKAPLQATYSGVAKAQFGFTEYTGRSSQSYSTSFSGTATATGKLDLVAKMTSDPTTASFQGSFSGFVADPVKSTQLRDGMPADFNKQAVAAVLPQSVPVTGTISATTVSGTAGTQVGIYTPTQFYNALPATRSKDALPASLTIAAGVMSPRTYTPQGGWLTTTMVSYSGTAVRK